MGLKSLGNPQSSFDNYSATTGTDASSASFVQSTDLGVQATGGTTNTYFIGNSKYKSHTFTNGQTFQVTALSDDASTYPNSVDLLLVGGGGGNRTPVLNNSANESFTRLVCRILENNTDNLFSV